MVMLLMLSEPSVSASAAVMLSGMAESSLPVAACTVTVGASATELTVTLNVDVVVAVLPPTLSVAVARIVTVKSASELAAGVSVRPLSCAGVSVHVPPPLLVPADNVAPVGKPLSVMLVIDSEPSVSAKAAVRFRAITVSSAPVTFCTVTAGASATAVTVTLNVAVVVAVPPAASVEVARTVSEKSASELAGGVIRSSDNCAGVNVQVPLPLLVPADSVAPFGTPLTVMLVIDSEPSTSASAAVIGMRIAVSSLPVTFCTVTTGASVTAFTVTLSVAVVSAEPPAPSNAVAFTVRLKSASELAGGVMVRPFSCAGVSVHTPAPLLVPADSVAPVGTPLIVMLDIVSEPSVSRRAAPMLSAIGVSSLPVAA